MESSEAKHRLFRPATVGTCHAQTATDRFGDEAKRAILDRERTSLGLHPAGMEWPTNWPGSEGDQHEDHPLYFSAYRGRVFVYVPRSVPKQTIPQHPDVQLVTSPSQAALKIRGYLDPTSPHSINHMIVGSLGQEEVVLTCHDDGDVIAFYTKDVVEYILAKSAIPSSATPKQRRASVSSLNAGNAPKPFFQENVGISAWGLALHQKSRLIAVSSNRYEVTVFAPALATNGSRSSRNCDCEACCDGVESHVRRRARNWRIVVSLGPLADNIPNISFVDDKYGYAEKISAIDIKGAMWLADIWKAFQAAIRVMPSTSPLLKSEEFWPATSRGWGILALPNTSFLAVRSEEELLGAELKDLEMVPKLQAGPHPMVNLAKTIRDLPDNPCTQPPLRNAIIRVDDPPQNVQLAADMGDDEFAFDDVSDDEAFEPGESEPDEGAEADDGQNAETNSDDELEPGEDLEIGGDDGNDDEMLYDITYATEYAAQSDIPSTLANQAEEIQASHTSNVALPVGQPVLTALPNPTESSLPVQHLFTDPFASLIPSEPESEGFLHDHARFPPPSSRCLKLRPRNAPVRLDMIYMPHSGKVLEAPRRIGKLTDFLRRGTEYNENTAGYVTGLGKFAERYHMLRLYEKDVEMRTLDKPRQRGLPELGILCPYALTMGLTPGRAMRPHFRATSRLNMVAHIPELCLVVIGSPIGRVLLVTPTRLVNPIEKLAGVLHYGLRVDWVLPRQSDEAVFRVSKRPLHGMAIGPVQEDGVLGGVDETRRVAVPRRYRLMLHYRNHDILTYEISREEQTGKLCIF
ncbi:hypothetical protein MAC_03000 [Metarhizium acridum CQMa 102]|uniref:Pyridine nucleotide-disulfide oxidoreductase family protein n=1 Tax=Metarhizium acridum (strain CQMa 102) TaxID=655827 RepID=E9DZF2_METAQ|nr:uncharacterized protein MAC_03000 [Metarhizium acridum CQMa 102]EFY90884.1 hypothetical protein MAC_03000 [Metarhizium acridum CQMa 102]